MSSHLCLLWPVLEHILDKTIQNTLEFDQECCTISLIGCLRRNLLLLIRMTPSSPRQRVESIETVDFVRRL